MMIEETHRCPPLWLHVSQVELLDVGPREV